MIAVTGKRLSEIIKEIERSMVQSPWKSMIIILQ